MSGPCSKCSHFRRARPLSQLLRAAFEDDLAAAEVTGALTKIADDEQKLREAEAELKGREGAAGRDLWGARPLMSDYCGHGEADEVYRIHEVKNRDGCDDFKPDRSARSACGDCAHRVGAEGRTRDLKIEWIYTRLITDAAIAQSSQSPQGQLESYRGGAASRKAFEIAAAYESKGRLMAKPEYLDHCGALSTQDEYVVCVIQNPHNTCPSWKGTNGESNE